MLAVGIAELGFGFVVVAVAVVVEWSVPEVSDRPSRSGPA